jgi:hypothetical protein
MVKNPFGLPERCAFPATLDMQRSSPPDFRSKATSVTTVTYGFGLCIG